MTWQLSVVLMALVLAGCAAGQSYDFSPVETGRDLHVRIMPKSKQLDACAPSTSGRWDDGSYRPAGWAGAGQACFMPWNNTIWLPFGSSAMTLLHEICHWARRPKEECAEIR